MSKKSPKEDLTENGEDKDIPIIGSPFSTIGKATTIEGVLKKMTAESNDPCEIIDSKENYDGKDSLAELYRHRTYAETVVVKDEDRGYHEWSERFKEIVHEVAIEYDMDKYIRSIKRKRKANNLFQKLRVSFRFSWKKEDEAMAEIMKEVMLRVNDYDDKSLEKLNEFVKDRCIEGIRENSDLPLYGSHIAV